MRVAIVGGGIAGLACAWRLQQSGYRADVFERDAAAGGRMRSERRGAFVVDRGAQFIASGYRNLHAVAREVGLADCVRPLGRASNAILRAGRLEPGDYDTPASLLRSRLLSTGAKLRLPRILIEVWRHRRRLDPRRPQLAAAIDREDMPTYYGVAFPRREGLDLYGLAVDHHKPGVCPPNAGLLNAALTATAAARMWDRDDDAVIALVLDTLAATPIGRLRPIDACVHRWDPMLPQFYAGYLPGLAAFLERTDRSPRLIFAGDYLVGPYTEAALTSGLRAADAAAAACRPSGFADSIHPLPRGRGRG